MRILFAISMLAFAGLLWASLAAAQHVRRQKRRARESETSLQGRSEAAPKHGTIYQRPRLGVATEASPRLESQQDERLRSAQQSDRASSEDQNRLLVKEVSQLHPIMERRKIHAH